MTKVRILRTVPGGGGGNRYQDDVARALADAADVEIVPVYPPPDHKARRPRTLQAVRRAVGNAPAGTVHVVDLLGLAALVGVRARGPVIGLVHHVDPLHGRGVRKGLSVALTAASLAGARRADRVVVVADYWRERLQARGVDGLRVVHNAFDPDAYRVSPEAVAALRRQAGAGDRPLVYLGNCQAAKGVVESHRALHDAPYAFVTSGERRVQLPVPNLELEPEEYVALLAASDVVLTMSRFPEGWNRTAHEAMLLGTPVVGSGSGGMRELLTGGGQIVCPDFDALPGCVSRALAERETLGARGRAFARTFDLARFGRAWRAVLAEVTG